MNPTPDARDLQLAFDVGHSSIGWAALQTSPNQSPTLLGCGSVIFQADDCLASQRRGFRRQRRHIRATRLRIARIKTLLAHLGVLSAADLDKNNCAWPWFLSARVLRGGKTLTWAELWDVLRWYAHNRGYDGNKGWSSHDADAADDDTEKEKRAGELLNAFRTKHGRAGTMAEVFCDVLKIDPLGAVTSSMERVRGLGAAFPRDGVEAEVERILRAHLGGLAQVDERLIEALMRDHSALPSPDLRLPKRYGQRVNGVRTPGGLLFGQLVPRFDNRIIATCPIMYQRVFERELAADGDEDRARYEATKLSKVPNADCPEFYAFRWAMQLANVQVATGNTHETRRLTMEERALVHAEMKSHGALTPRDFKKAVRALTGGAKDNLDQMLALPDADKALVLDPARKRAASGVLGVLWPQLDVRTRQHTLTNLRRDKAITARALLAASPAAEATFDHWWDGEAMKKPRKGQTLRSREQVLDERHTLPSDSGRAPYTRQVMREVVEYILRTGRHPTEGTEGAADNGPLYRSEAIRHAQLRRALDEQTNNHLVRHRLKMLERLHTDLLKEYAGGDKARIARITVEVNRDLKEMSGKTAQEQAKTQGQMLANFKSVEKKLREELGSRFPRSGAGSLLRKARVLDDLKMQCPYTGHIFEFKHLLEPGKISLDHVVPHSDRKTNAMDALVVTFTTVNEMKGKRTALQFIEEFGGQAVRGMPGVMIRPKAAYVAFVETLLPKYDPRKSSYHKEKRIPIDDDLRKWRRKEKLLLRDYVEKEFTPGDLTKTSQLVRLGAQALHKHYLGGEKIPVITSLPGSVTGAVRKSWNLIGCLALANPLVLNSDDLDENGNPKVHRKTEIRGITHLHHALDGCVLAFASLFLPRDGGAWELLVKRRLKPDEQKRARAVFGSYIEISSEGELRLGDLAPQLKEQICRRLAERRVVQHLPSDRGGLPTKETVWRVFDPTDQHHNTRRLARWLKEKLIAVPAPEESAILLIRRKRRDAAIEDAGGGKLLRETKTWRWIYDEVERTKVLGLGERGSKRLCAIKGGKLIADNYGLALFPDAPKGESKFRPIRFFRVWEEIDKLPRTANGRRPPILRRGQLITFARGAWARKIWRVLGIEENGRVRFFEPDKVRRIDNPENYQKAQIGSLLRDGLHIYERVPLCGVPPPEAKPE